MDEIFNWLKNQKGGTGTYIEFQRRMLALRLVDAQNAALARLLADLAGRFADAYDGEPLPVSVASEALSRLTGYVEKAVRAKDVSLADQLALLNEIGLAELA
jgi:hypothetical protein